MQQRCISFLDYGLRGFALFLGSFALISTMRGFLSPGFAANIWWIDLRFLPGWAEQFFLLALSLSLLTFAAGGPATSCWRWIRLGLLSLACMVTAYNALTCLLLLRGGRLHAGWMVPFSLVLTVMLGACVVSAARKARPATPEPTVGRWPLAVGAVCMLLAFPFALMFFFGRTDYRRPADVVVVFGARAYEDGSCSSALADRVRTACRLYQEGYASHILFSGGPGDGTVHETEAMRRLAMRLGIPQGAILCDEQGLNTRATVRETIVLARKHHWNRILAVSHSYHLPRIKLTFQQEGADAYTVPAQERYTLRQMPYLMLREIAAFWTYYALA